MYCADIPVLKNCSAAQSAIPHGEDVFRVTYSMMKEPKFSAASATSRRHEGLLANRGTIGNSMHAQERNAFCFAAEAQ